MKSTLAFIVLLVNRRCYSFHLHLRLQLNAAHSRLFYWCISKSFREGITQKAQAQAEDDKVWWRESGYIEMINPVKSRNNTRNTLNTAGRWSNKKKIIMWKGYNVLQNVKGDEKAFKSSMCVCVFMYVVVSPKGHRWFSAMLSLMMIDSSL